MSYDMKAIADAIKKKYSKLDPDIAESIGIGTDLPDPMSGDFIKMPEWWVKATHTPGIPFGRMVMVAGPTNSGKTSGAIEVIRAALEQNVGVIYVETENKTGEDRFISWGVDPAQILVVKNSIAETAFQAMFESWDGFKKQNPEAPLLVVIDSIGNVISQRDSEIDLKEDSQKPGGKGQINRLAINKMIAKMRKDKVAVFLVNYTYSNIGSKGQTNAGGRALDMFSSLTYQTSRMGWVDKTVQGEQYNKGVDVVWTLYKNHINVSDPGPKKIVLRIGEEGIEYRETGKKKKNKDGQEVEDDQVETSFDMEAESE